MTDDRDSRIHTLLLERMRDEPPAPPLPDLVDTCRRDHRRRVGIGVAAATALAVLAVVPATALLRDDPAPVEFVDVPDMTDQQVVDLCLTGNQSDRVTETFVASGRPALAVRGSAAATTTVALVSADGRYWADCFVHHDAGAEFGSGMTVYDTTLPSQRPGYSIGYACPDHDGPPMSPCPTFVVRLLDRLPNTVAAVDFRTADGRTTRVETDDRGFVLFAYEGAVPAGYPTDSDEPIDWLTRITYVGPSGEPIAASNMDHRADPPEGVHGLPSINRYPSLASRSIELQETSSTLVPPQTERDAVDERTP